MAPSLDDGTLTDAPRFVRFVEFGGDVRAHKAFNLLQQIRERRFAHRERLLVLLLLVFAVSRHPVSTRIGISTPGAWSEGHRFLVGPEEFKVDIRRD